MGEGKQRLTLSGSIIILSICILLSGFMISIVIRDLTANIENGDSQDEWIQINHHLEELEKTL